MRSLGSKGLVVVAGLIASQTVAMEPQTIAELPQRNDPRLALLNQFLAQRDCPIKKFAEDFLEAADQNDLDWRLLPSISVIESGGGKDYRNNNVFGWDSCRQAFPSIRDGIHIVASRLANSKLYKDKDLEGILRTYNQHPDYPARVQSVMRSIAANPAMPGSSLN